MKRQFGDENWTKEHPPYRICTMFWGEQSHHNVSGFSTAL